MNEKALNNQIKQGLLMWLVCMVATLVIYLCGENPLKASMLIVADIVFPIVTLLLVIKKKNDKFQNKCVMILENAV